MVRIEKGTNQDEWRDAINVQQLVANSKQKLADGFCRNRDFIAEGYMLGKWIVVAPKLWPVPAR
ncbi:hypothetical protein BUE76_05375 [Cnuella takakiae]|nr:hypothetical protein BUE76_05375 [Cnuella takakiae]